MNLFTAFLARNKKRRTLESLRQLDDRLLRDIGLDRSHFGRFNEFPRLQDLGR